MKHLSNPKNQWLVLELKLCRSALGLTQKNLADLSEMSLDSIKRLERSGAEPRLSTINKLRELFNYLGVRCNIDENGKTILEFRNSLVNAINEGRHDKYIDERTEAYKINRTPEPFDE